MFNSPSSPAPLASERIFSRLLSRRCLAPADTAVSPSTRHTGGPAWTATAVMFYGAAKRIGQRRMFPASGPRSGRAACTGCPKLPIESTELHVWRIDSTAAGVQPEVTRRVFHILCPQDRTAISLVNNRSAGPLKPNMPPDFKAKLVTVLVTMCPLQVSKFR
jgi:hypothetical protein